MKTVYKTSDSVRMEPVGERFVLFDLRTNLPFVLNRTAAQIVDLSDGSRSLEAVASTICRTYDIPYETAVKDTRQIYDQLSANHVIQIVE